MHKDFSADRSGGLVFPSLSEVSTVVINTVKSFGIVNKAEVDVFLELSCFFNDPADVVLIYFKQILFELEIWLLKPSSPGFPGD